MASDGSRVSAEAEAEESSWRTKLEDEAGRDTHL